MGKPPRLAGFSYRGRIRVFITCVTLDRLRAFEDRTVCEFMLTELFAKARRFKIAVTAYCLMPDHGHLLLTGIASDSNLGRMMRRWKQASGYWYSQRFNRRLWQGNYYDHVLRDPDDSLSITLYIIADPLRSGLVRDLNEYEWWGSETWSRAELLAECATMAQPRFWSEDH